jgi:S1-C subfamily serine protease
MLRNIVILYPTTKWVFNLVWCLILGMFPMGALADHGRQTWANAASSVVIVNPTWPGYNRPGFGAPPGTAPAGSGVYIAVDGVKPKGLVLTAAHVVYRASSIEIVDFAGRSADAEIIAIDMRRDLALLKSALDGKAISLRRDTPDVGSHVCALGNSFGLGVSISCGVVSAVNRTKVKINEIEDFVQTDAAINPGGSGGALVDADGQLVGLVDAIFTKEADIDAGVNFAVSISLIDAWINNLKARGDVF